MAELSLLYIEEHYKFYQSVDNRGKSVREPLINASKDKEWFVPCKHNFFHSLKLIDDNGKLFIYGAPWCGYFESLNNAEVVEVLPVYKRVEFN